MEYEKFAISLPQDLVNEAREINKKTGRTFSGLIRVSLEKEISRIKED